MSNAGLIGILASTEVTDDALVRWDGTSRQFVQDSAAAAVFPTLTDAGVLTLAKTTSQAVLGATVKTVTFAGITLTPLLVIHQPGPLNPTMGMLRDATAVNGCPGFNYFRSNGGGAVKNGDLLGVFSASGHDGTDYAAGAEIDIVVDEADTGTATVGSNQMGCKLRLRTSRRGASAPAFGAQVRHNGAFQLNTAITLATTTATGMGGSFEADTKVVYYTLEDACRGVVEVEYVTCIASAFTLNATTTEQPMFPAGQQTLTLPTGLYEYECIGALSSMSATPGNTAFDLVGAGTALLARTLNVIDGMDAASNTANANSGSYNTAAQTPVSMIIAAAGTEMGFRIHGTFCVTASGTITPSLTLVTAAAAVVAAGSRFSCHPVGSLLATCTGPWT